MCGYCQTELHTDIHGQWVFGMISNAFENLH
jgi:hypothetical protein